MTEVERIQRRIAEGKNRRKMKDIYLIMERAMQSYDAQYDGVLAAFTDKDLAEKCAKLDEREVITVQLMESVEDAAALIDEHEAILAGRQEEEEERERERRHWAAVQKKEKEDKEAINEAQKRIAADPELAREILKR